jgi:hypothetical protein
MALPSGLTFGRVPAAAGPGIVAGLERGEIALEHLRGRAGDPWAAQAADVFARRELGLPGLDALAIEGVEADGASRRCGCAPPTGPPETPRCADASPASARCRAAPSPSRSRPTS